MSQNPAGTIARNFQFQLVFIPTAIILEIMKSGRFTIVLAGCLCPAMILGASDLAVNEKPYSPIVTRNIFGLVPIPTNAPVDVNANATPPPKITANGIMTIFGNKEALFKVATPPKPGQPAGDQSYVLSEGESQDDIAVVKIDDVADVITFNNHGTIQVLPLSAAPNLNTPAPVAGAPGLPMPNAGGVAGTAGRFPRPFGGAGFGGRRAVPPPAAPAINTDANGEDGLSPEARAIVIEKNYLDAKANNNPSAPIFPPTVLRGQADGDQGEPEPPPGP